MSVLFSWLVLSLAFLATAWILPGMKVNGLAGAATSAAVFGVLNWLLAKVLFVVLGIATLGIGFLLFFITAWVVNVILLKITDAVSDSLELKSTGTAMAAALLISVIGAGIRVLLT